MEGVLTHLQLLQPVLTFGLPSLTRFEPLPPAVWDVMVGLWEGELLAPALRLRW